MIQINKDKLQAEIVQEIHDNNGHGIIATATGTGKTKCIIDYIKSININNILWVVPTRKLRDITIPEEFLKWNAQDIFDDKVSTICYSSLSKITNKQYQLVVLDEGHNVTEHNSKFFCRNEVQKVLMLTATVPHEAEKLEILKSLNLDIIYELLVDDAVKQDVVSPYNIIVVESNLDRTTKNIKAGSKEKSFYTTEGSNYDYITNSINENIRYGRKPSKWHYLNRMRFIYNLPSKQYIANKILSKISHKTRLLIFCSTIKQAESLCRFTYHSKTDDSDYNLFNNKQINRISVVNALNEGHNMIDVDMLLIVQVNSNQRNYFQKQGRGIRWRKNHRTIIYILSVTDTVDANWVNLSIKSLDKNNITTINHNNI